MKLWMAVDTYINTYDNIDFKLAHNFMSDWTPAERESRLLGKRSSTQPETKPVSK
jgi:hypothetical protein